MLNLAKAHGWQPVGTVPFDSIKLSPESEPPENTPRGNYKPEEDSKTVTANDVSALADALARAKKAMEESGSSLPRTGALLLKDGMREDEFARINSDITPAYLEEFIRFLRKGGFGFSWDD